MIQRIHILNGPNLNLLGRREPEIYGSLSFESYLTTLRQTFSHIELLYLQTNHEGVLLDYLHAHGFDDHTGILLNAGGWTHTSIALRDAVAAIDVPVVEVHISDIFNREPFRAHSYLTEVCVGHFMGHGLEGYRMGMEWLLNLGR